MAYIDGVNERTVVNFGSPIEVTDAYGIPAESSFLAKNVTYVPGGEVATRLGHSVVFTPNNIISAMNNWLLINLGNQINYLVYYTPSVGVRVVPVPTPVAATIMTQTTAAGAVFAPAGSRIFAVFYKNTGLADSGGQVYSIANGADALFRRPPLTSEVTVSFTEGAANSGNIVAGIHRMGFYLTTANGYSTRLAPIDTSINFVPQNFTASGGRNVTMTLTPSGYTWPTGASVTVVMTTTTNLNTYYTVPLLAPTFVAGTGTYNIQFDINDGDLSADGTNVSLQQTVFSQDASNNPPFLPQFIALFGERMGMTGRDSAGVPVTYFSEPNSYQTMTAAQHGVYLPGNLVQTLFFQLRGVCYILGPHWTYSVTDSGQPPAQWADAQLVDGTIGALGPYCVWNDVSTGIAWVADQGGLYTFSGGQYSRLPVSYYVSNDWSRINWADPTQIFVTDDKDKKRVRVMAPLDSATKPSHILNFYYIDGVTAEQIKYSLDNLAGYSLGASTMVQGVSGRQEAWFGPSVAGAVIRANDGSETHPYRDVAAAINCQFKLGLLPGVTPDIQKSTVNFHHASRMRVTGSGRLGMKIYSLDNNKVVTPAKSPLSLSTSPGFEYVVRFALMSEQASMLLDNSNQVDGWFRLAQVTWCYSLGVPQR